MKYNSVLILFFLFACDLSEPSPDDPRIKEQVQQKIILKIADWRNDCIHAATIQAEAAVDSTLRVMALDEKLTIYNPPDKPLKPFKPQVPSILDTSPIVPLEKNIQILDSLVQKDSVIIED